jgi:hypothetical protein
MLEQLTVVQPYYNQVQAVAKHLDNIRNINPKYQNRLRFIWVDDCSPVPLNSTLVGKINFNLNLIVFRIKQSILWNNAGADNLGLEAANPESWVLRLDFDYGINQDFCEKIFNMDEFNDKSILYRFNVTRIVGAKNQRLHVCTNKNPNNFIINPNTFWKTKGYDEDFSGRYGYADSLMMHQLNPFISQEKQLNVAVVRVKFGDTNIPRTGKEINKYILEGKLTGNLPIHSSDILRFEYDKVKVYGEDTD